MQAYDAKRAARVRSLMQEGLETACRSMGHRRLADRFSIVNPSPSTIHGAPIKPESLHVVRKALTSEGAGTITMGFTYDKLSTRDDDEIRSLKSLRIAAVDLVRAFRRERQIALHSPHHANPAWSCHAHPVMKSLIDLAHEEAEISPHLAFTTAGIHDTRTPYCPQPHLTRWAQCIRNVWRDAQIKRTTIAAGRISTPEIDLVFGEKAARTHRVEITSMLYTSIEVKDVNLSTTISTAIESIESAPLRSIVDLPCFDGLDDLSVHFITHRLETNGLMTLRSVVEERRVPMGAPPPGVDMSFMTVGEDLLAQ